MYLIEKEKPLTKREVELIHLIAKGKKTIEIAEVLFVSKNTIETHRKNILRKLNCNTFCAVMSYAFQHGILKIEQKTTEKYPKMGIA